MQGWARMTFGHLGTGTGMAQPIPKFWEREWEWKISFPTFGNGNGKIPFPIFGNWNGNSIPAFREREWDVVIPGNDWELERELHRKIESNFFIIPLFNPTNILHCNHPQICSQHLNLYELSLSHLTFHSTGQAGYSAKSSKTATIFILLIQIFPESLCMIFKEKMGMILTVMS